MNNAGFYDGMEYFDTLKWDDIFSGPEEFVAKTLEFGGIDSVTDVDKLSELYEILSLKYFNSHTRYTDEISFRIALKRELASEFSSFLERKNIMRELEKIEIEEIREATSQLRNLVTNPEDPTDRPDKKAFQHLSNQQEVIRVTSGRLDALKDKYSALARDYTNSIYRAVDKLFRVILADDVRYVYFD